MEDMALAVTKGNLEQVLITKTETGKLKWFAHDSSNYFSSATPNEGFSLQKHGALLIEDDWHLHYNNCPLEGPFNELGKCVKSIVQGDALKDAMETATGL